MAKRPTTRCALCGTTAKLCKSHILSDFLYEDAKDQARQFISVSKNPRHSTRPMQKGHWEHLLCSACEGRLSEWERFAAPVLRLARTKKSPYPWEVRLGPYDARIRLFFLSLLWRAHVSRHDAVAMVELGAMAAPLRQILLCGDPQEWWRYPVAVIRLEGSQAAARSIIPATEFLKVWGKTTYRMMAFGFVWLFVVSDEPRDGRPRLPFLGSRDRITFGRQEVTDEGFLREIAGLARTWGKL